MPKCFALGPRCRLKTSKAQDLRNIETLAQRPGERRVGDVDGGLTEAERTERIAGLKDKLLTAEREEALIVFAVEHGVDVMRRPLTSAVAILGVEAKKIATVVKAVA
jgi:hypothetical protein